MAFDIGSFLMQLGPGISQTGQNLGAGLRQSRLDEEERKRQELQSKLAGLQISSLGRQEQEATAAAEREQAGQGALKTHLGQLGEMEQFRGELSAPGAKPEDYGLTPSGLAGVRENLSKSRYQLGMESPGLQGLAETKPVSSYLAGQEKLAKIISPETVDPDLKIRMERNKQLSQEAENRLKQQASKAYETSPYFDGLRETTKYMKTAIDAMRENTVTSDALLVKALEKQVQEGAVLQGEADAYAFGGSLYARIKESGLWDAVDKKLKGKLPSAFRADMFKFIQSLYGSRVEGFEKFRQNKINFGVNDLGFSPDAAARIYTPIEPLQDYDKYKADPATGILINMSSKIGKFQRVK